MNSFTISTIVISVLFTACQSNKSTENTIKGSGDIEIKPELTVDSTISNYSTKTNAELLMEKSDCYTCHIKDSKLIGPSFLEISKKYENKNDDVNLLVDKIINGGSGVWGDIPMQAHSKLSNSDAKEMVQYILTLNK